jgi:transcription antitermination factor NusG
VATEDQTLIEPSAQPLDPIPEPSCDWSTLTWHALVTNIRCEQRAALGLRARGFEVFVPVARRWVRNRRGKRIWRHLERPLFPSYVFVGIRPGDLSWRFRLRWLDGIQSIVTSSGLPADIPARHVAGLYDEVTAGIHDEDRRPRRVEAYELVGKTVLVDVGSYTRLTGVVVARKSSTRVEVEVTCKDAIDRVLRRSMIVPIDRLAGAA